MIAAVSGCQNAETESETTGRPTVSVERPIQRVVVDYAYFTGQIQAVESVQIRARVTGYLKAISYKPGTNVQKGAVLFEIDPLQYQAQVDIAKGKLAEAQSQVLQGKAKVAEANARVDLARSKLAIDQEVAKTSGAMSKLTLEEDAARVRESEATVEESKATVTALDASVKAAEAQLEYNQLNLDWTQVKSPIAGRADRNLLTVGNLVTADSTLLTNVVDTDEVYVYFDVDELTCLELQRGLREGVYTEPKNVPIAIALQDEKTYPHKGMMDLVANKLDQSTGTLKIRGKLTNTDKMLTPGNFVRIRLPVDKPRERLLVPDRAVIPEQGDSFLLVLGSDDKVEKRKVTAGGLDPDDKTLRIIEEGLKPNEWFLINRVPPGTQVEAKRISQPEKPAASPKPQPAKK